MRKLAFLFVVLLGLLSGSVWGAPSVVDSCIGIHSSGTTISCTVNSNSGSNLLLMVGVYAHNSVTIDTVTHNGDSATAISASAEDTTGSTRLRTFYRIAPDAGVGLTVTATMSGDQPAEVIAVVLQDVNQSTPYENESTHDPESGETSGSQNVTSASGDLVLDFYGLGHSTGADDQTVTQGAGQTMIENDTEVDNLRFFSSTEAGAATVTMSHSWSPNNMNSLGRAYNINALSAGGVVPIVNLHRRRRAQ